MSVVLVSPSSSPFTAISAAAPTADLTPEQQRLLANLIIQMSLAKKPLPRFWYFPNGKPAVVIMTGDDHANGGTAGRFDQYISLSPANCNVASKHRD